jgi:hypothetical protein
MTDLEWARAFVGCKIEGTGMRFNDTVDVLVKKLAQMRQDALRDFQASLTTSQDAAVPDPSSSQAPRQFELYAEAGAGCCNGGCRNAA